MKQEWIDYHMKLANLIAMKSKDATKVGAVIVAEDMSVRSTGFNGFPRGCLDHPALYADRETKLKRVVHAEGNAIAQAAKSGTSTNGCSLVVNFHPCSNCASLAINAGIKAVICPAPDMESKWVASFEEASRMFEEAGIEVIYTENKNVP